MQFECKPSSAALNNLTPLEPQNHLDYFLQNSVPKKTNKQIIIIIQSFPKFGNVIIRGSQIITLFEINTHTHNMIKSFYHEQFYLCKRLRTRVLKL